jgi:hypothetical protein
MYINLSTFTKSQLLFSDLIFLCAISQTETEWLIENLTEDIYKRFEALSLIKHIKAKNKKEHSYESLRLSDKGKQLLSELDEAEVEEQDTKVLEWMCEQYLKAEKTIGNKKRTVRHIRDFRIKSGIQKNNLIRLCLDFLSDEDNMEYNNVLEFAFYKPMTAFQTKFQLEDSRLYKHYIKHRERLDNTFEIY